MSVSLETGRTKDWARAALAVAGLLVVLWGTWATLNGRLLTADPEASGQPGPVASTGAGVSAPGSQDSARTVSETGTAGTETAVRADTGAQPNAETTAGTAALPSNEGATAAADPATDDAGTTSEDTSASAPSPQQDAASESADVRTSATPEREPGAATTEGGPDATSDDAEPTLAAVTDKSASAQAETAIEPALTDPLREDRPDHPDVPTFDIVRIEADGQAVVAGRTSPDTTVEVLIDDSVVGEARSDASGSFVAIFSTTPSSEAQKLRLRVPDEGSAKDQALAAATQSAEVSAGTGPAQSDNEAGSSAVTQPAPAPQSSDPAPATTAGDHAASAADGSAEPASEGQAADQTAQSSPTPRAEPTDIALALADTASADTAQAVPKPPSDNSLTDQTAGTGAVEKSPAPEASAADPAPDATDSADTVRYRVSAPVIILPSAEPSTAPTLVQPKDGKLTVVQPGSTSAPGSVILDLISYNEVGDVRLTGRGAPPQAVRIYGNGLILGTTRIAEDGTWTINVDRTLGTEVKLFRFDQVDASGKVTSRIETPFQYSTVSPQILRERKVVIQRGDMLWRIAEQYYGEGLRYSLIYGANSTLIRDPDLIYPGQVFSIPELVDAN